MVHAILSTAGGAVSALFSGAIAILCPFNSLEKSARVDGFAEDRRAMAGDLRKVGDDMRVAMRQFEKSPEYQKKLKSRRAGVRPHA